MTKFRLFASALLVAMSVSAFAAENLTCSGFEYISGLNNCSYGSTFMWTASTANTMQIFALPDKNLADYSALKFTPSKLLNYKSSGTPYVRIVFYGINKGNTKSDSTFVTKSFYTIDGNVKSIDLTATADFGAKLDSIVGIAIGGAGVDSASFVIDPSSIKLVKKSDSSEQVCTGLVERTGNNKCSFTENRFSWCASNANNMTIFSFAEGTLANYDSITFNTSGWGAPYRVIFVHSEGANAQVSFNYTGENKKVDFTNSSSSNYPTGINIEKVTSIRFAGNSAKGALTILPSSIVLHAKKTNPTALDNANVNVKVVKVIENGQVFILRDGVRYNTLGQVVK